MSCRSWTTCFASTLQGCCPVWLCKHPVLLSQLDTLDSPTYMVSLRVQTEGMGPCGGEHLGKGHQAWRHPLACHAAAQAGSEHAALCSAGEHLVPSWTHKPVASGLPVWACLLRELEHKAQNCHCLATLARLAGPVGQTGHC